MNHYVYQIISMTPNEEGVCRIYSGLRSCECLPEEDTEYMGSGHAIKGAIAKYGRDKFMKIIVAKFDTREEAHECETQWLEKQFNFHGRDWNRFSKFNYNLRLNENSRDGFSRSPETRAKQSAAMMGKWSGEKHPNFGKTLSKETKNKIGSAQLGERNHNFGKKTPDEVKKKISAANSGLNSVNLIGLTIGKNTQNQIIVFCGGRDIVHRGFNQGAVSAVILKNRSHHQGFTFTRTNDPDQLRIILNTADFYDEISKQRIQEFLSK